VTQSKGDPGDALGYLAQVTDSHTYVGGLFVVGPEGDPLDFAYTEPVTLSPLERFLLGGRADAYVLTRVMLPALIAQAKVQPSILLMEDASVLVRRVNGATPVVVAAAEDARVKDGAWEPIDADGETFWASPNAPVHLLTRAIVEMAPFTIREPFEQLRRTLAEMRRGR
jgi:hypothetical protein